MIVNGNIEILDGSPGWRKASTYHTGGTLSNGDKSFTPPSGGYTSVVYNRTFAAGENFRIIAYWAHDYMGAGFVYGANVHHFDFNGYSADSYGPYAGALNTSGFPNGYAGTFFGQYHAPIGGGGGSAPGYHIKWERSGNVITLQYSTISADGPWIDFTSSSTATIASTDAVCIVCGEAGSNGATLTLVDNYASLRHNGREVFGYSQDSYKYSLNLIRGFIGGGYIGGVIYNQVTKLAFATDAWSTMSNNLNKAIKYGGWASSLVNGYVYHNVQNGDVTNDRVNFPTDSVQSIANRPNGAGGSPSSTQEGVGFTASQLPSYQGDVYNTVATYGTKAFEMGKGGSLMDILTFSTETWATESGAPSGQYGVGWFNKDYSYMFASSYGGNNTVTNRMPHTTRSWVQISTTSSPGALGLPAGGAEKGVNSKYNKFYLAGNWGGSYCGGSDGNRIFQFRMDTDTWSINTGSQTRWNNEHSGVMGQTHGYFAGGYNCTDGQNAHSDKINYTLDTVIQIADAPRQISSASPMWSSY